LLDFTTKYKEKIQNILVLRRNVTVLSPILLLLGQVKFLEKIFQLELQSLSAKYVFILQEKLWLVSSIERSSKTKKAFWLFLGVKSDGVVTRLTQREAADAPALTAAPPASRDGGSVCARCQGCFGM